MNYKSAWGMFRSKTALPAKFETGDNRAKFFTKRQAQYLDDITDSHLKAAK